MWSYLCNNNRWEGKPRLCSGAYVFFLSIILNGPQ